jgi:TonB-dependent receptor
MGAGFAGDGSAAPAPPSQFRCKPVIRLTPVDVKAPLKSGVLNMIYSRKMSFYMSVGVLALACATTAKAQDNSAIDTTIGDLVVSGQRVSEARSVEAKRKSDNLIEVLSASDVGKLPDQNVAEALRRLPAVSVANDQGEGRYVIIRGVDPNLANVTVNGAVAAVPEPEGRQIKLDDIPSSLIARVEVIKSLTPDLDANAIAGQVDITTLSAFDRSGSFIYARTAVGQSDINDAHPVEADLTVGGAFGPDRQFGAVVSANYSRRPIESQNFGASGPDFATVGGFTVPTLEELRDYNLVRERKGVTANFDWRPTDNAKLYLRTLYSEFSDDETRDRFRIDNESSFSNQTETTGTFRGRGIAYIRRRMEDDNTRSALLGGDFTLPVGELVAEAGYSRAEKKDPLRSEVQFRTGGTALTVAYDVATPLYVFTPSANFYDPATYASFNSVNYDSRQATDTLKQARVDWTLPFTAMSEGSTLKFGAKLLDREKSNDRDIQAYNGGAARPTLATTARPGDVTIFDGRYTLGPRVDYEAFQAYVTANPTSLVLNPSGTVGDSLVDDYEAGERVLAGYGMATLRYGGLTLIPGVRVERTQGDYKAKTITAGSTATQDFNTTGEFSYTDVFPGVNARYDVSDDLVLRAAVTTAIGRPNFSDLAPYVSVDASGSGEVSMGNPDLEPLKSVNVDGAVEYYLPGHGILSVGAFYKDIDKPIFSTVRTAAAGETFGGVAVPATTEVTQPTNAGRAKVKGVELNLSTPLDFLPSPLDGFGVSANLAFIDSEATGVSGRADTLPLALQSDQVATVQIFYEKAGFQARLAWSHRSKYLLAAGAAAADDQYVDDHSQLDARVSYTLKPVTLFVEGSNLGDEPYSIYVGDKSRLIERERYGYTVRTGVQLAF